MIVTAEFKRKNTLFNINQNPTSITIKRTEKVRKGGGFDEVTKTLGPFTVRIFMTARQSTKDDVSIGGIKQIDQWGMLAPYSADLKAGANVNDEFDTELGKFQVTGVFPQRWKGQITGYQCAIEKVT